MNRSICDHDRDPVVRIITATDHIAKYQACPVCNACVGSYEAVRYFTPKTKPTEVPKDDVPA